MLSVEQVQHCVFELIYRLLGSVHLTRGIVTGVQSWTAYLSLMQKHDCN